MLQTSLNLRSSSRGSAFAPPRVRMQKTPPPSSRRMSTAMLGRRHTNLTLLSRDRQRLEDNATSQKSILPNKCVGLGRHYLRFTTFAILIVACVFGILAGVAFHSPRPSPTRHTISGEGSGHHMYRHFVTEYDLVTNRYETLTFETDVRAGCH